MVKRETSKLPPPRSKMSTFRETRNILVKTIGDGGSSKLIDITEGINTDDGAGVPGSLMLEFIEACGDSGDDAGDGYTVVGFGSLLRPCQDHGR
jgi:hypothetical protein